MMIFGSGGRKGEEEEVEKSSVAPEESETFMVGSCDFLS